MYKYSQNFVRPQGRWDGDTVGRKVQRWLGGKERGRGQFVNLWWAAVFKISQTWGGEKLSECLLLGWKILNLVLKVVKPKILYVFAPEGRVPYLVFWGAGFSNQGEGALGAVGRHYKKCPLLLAFFQNCPPHLRF